MSTLNLSISASANDARLYGTTLTPNNWSQNLTSVGYFSPYYYHLYLLFDGVSGLSGATINSATLTLTTKGGSGSALTYGVVKIEDAASPSTISGYGDYNGRSWYGTTVAFNPNSANSSESVDIKTLIQYIADNYNPSTFSLSLSPTSLSETNVYSGYDYVEDSTKVATLNIDYTPISFTAGTTSFGGCKLLIGPHGSDGLKESAGNSNVTIDTSTITDVPATYNIVKTGTGTAYIKFNGGDLAVDTSYPSIITTGNDIYKRVYLYINTLPTAEERIFDCRNSSDSTLFYGTLNNSGEVKIYDSGDSLLGTSSLTLSTGTKYRLEIGGTLGSSGIIQLKIAYGHNKSVTQFTAGGNLGTTDFAIWYWGAYVNTNGSGYDINMWTGHVNSGRYPGAGRHFTLYPTGGSSTHTGWTGTYTDIDETSQDGDTTYVYTSASAAEGVTLSNVIEAGITGRITALQPLAFVKKISGTSALSARVYSGSSYGNGSDIDCLTSYQIIRHINETDPNTSETWSYSAIESVEPTIVSSNTTSVRCTALRLMVECEPPFDDATTNSSSLQPAPAGIQLIRGNIEACDGSNITPTSSYPGSGNFAFYGRNIGSSVYNSLTYQYFSSWSYDGYLQIFYRVLPNGAWKHFHFNGNGLTAIALQENDNHDSTTIELDSDGYFHFAGISHASTLAYYTSDKRIDEGWAGGVSGPSSFDGNSLTVSANNHCTYIRFFKSPLGVLYVIYRYYYSGQGDEYLFKYNTGTSTWAGAGGTPGGNGYFFQGQAGTKASAYMYGPPMCTSDFDDGGGHGYMYFAWTRRQYGGGTPVDNYDCVVIRWDGSSTWTDANGGAITMAVTNDNVTSGSKAYADTSGNIYNGVSSCLDVNDSPVIPIYITDGHAAGNITSVKIAYISGGSWTTTTLSFTFNQHAYLLCDSSNQLHVIHGYDSSTGIRERVSSAGDWTTWGSWNTLVAATTAFNIAPPDAAQWKEHEIYSMFGGLPHSSTYDRPEAPRIITVNPYGTDVSFSQSNYGAYAKFAIDHTKVGSGGLSGDENRIRINARAIMPDEPFNPTGTYVAQPDGSDFRGFTTFTGSFSGQFPLFPLDFSYDSSSGAGDGRLWFEMILPNSINGSDASSDTNFYMTWHTGTYLSGQFDTDTYGKDGILPTGLLYAQYGGRYFGNVASGDHYDGNYGSLRVTPGGENNEANFDGLSAVRMPNYVLGISSGYYIEALLTNVGSKVNQVIWTQDNYVGSKFGCRLYADVTSGTLVPYMVVRASDGSTQLATLTASTSIVGLTSPFFLTTYADKANTTAKLGVNGVWEASNTSSVTSIADLSSGSNTIGARYNNNTDTYDLPLYADMTHFELHDATGGIFPPRDAYLTWRNNNLRDQSNTISFVGSVGHLLIVHDITVTDGIILADPDTRRQDHLLLDAMLVNSARYGDIMKLLFDSPLIRDSSSLLQLLDRVNIDDLLITDSSSQQKTLLRSSIDYMLMDEISKAESETIRLIMDYLLTPDNFNKEADLMLTDIVTVDSYGLRILSAVALDSLLMDDSGEAFRIVVRVVIDHFLFSDFDAKAVNINPMDALIINDSRKSLLDKIVSEALPLDSTGAAVRIIVRQAVDYMFTAEMMNRVLDKLNADRIVIPDNMQAIIDKLLVANLLINSSAQAIRLLIRESADNLLMSDNHHLEQLKAFVDDLLITDNRFSSLDRQLVDFLFFYDSVSTDVSGPTQVINTRTVVDTLLMLDSHARDIEYSSMDSVLFSDDEFRAIFKQLIDSVSLLDVRQSERGLTAIDNLLIESLQSRIIEFLQSDSFSISDTVTALRLAYAAKLLNYARLNIADFMGVTVAANDYLNPVLAANDYITIAAAANDYLGIRLDASDYMGIQAATVRWRVQ